MDNGESSYRRFLAGDNEDCMRSSALIELTDIVFE